MFLSCLRSAKKSVFVASMVLVLLICGRAQDSQQPTAPEPKGDASAKPTTADPLPVQGPQPQQFVLKDYSKPRSAFPNLIAPYRPQVVPPPNLTNTPRIEQLMRDGKIML